MNLQTKHSSKVKIVSVRDALLRSLLEVAKAAKVALQNVNASIVEAVLSIKKLAQYWTSADLAGITFIKVSSLIKLSGRILISC